MFYDSIRYRSVERFFRDVYARLERDDVVLQELEERVVLFDAATGGSVTVGLDGFVGASVGVFYGFESDRYPYYALVVPTYLFRKVFRTWQHLSDVDDVLEVHFHPNTYSLRISLSDWNVPSRVLGAVNVELEGSILPFFKDVVISAPERGMYVFASGGSHG